MTLTARIFFTLKINFIDTSRHFYRICTGATNENLILLLFGFKARVKDRSLHGTLTALLLIKVLMAFNIFIDLKKAFHSIDHEIILKKTY